MRVVGNIAIAIGGRGGRAGVGGIGGQGGGGEVHGDNAFVVGGDGGDSGEADGRGGRGARSPMEQIGAPTGMWRFGRGGAGANAPEYDRRIAVLKKIREEYCEAFPDEVRFIDAGIDPVPVTWINKRLEEIGEGWRVSGEVTGYQMPVL